MYIVTLMGSKDGTWAEFTGTPPVDQVWKVDILIINVLQVTQDRTYCVAGVYTF